MTLQVVGAGLGRTGTHSLKLALERLLGGPCYHMVEVFAHPEHVTGWHAAIDGKDQDWTWLDGYTAIVDWPGAAVWHEMAAASPSAMVLLSTRESPEVWWGSFSQTILAAVERGFGPDMEAWFSMATDMLSRFCPSYQDPKAAMAAYEAHNDSVRRRVPPDRLIEWAPGDGWEPLCTALGIPEPAESFPHVNSTDEFRSMAGLNDESGS
jgi:Sulfotransferase domain